MQSGSKSALACLHLTHPDLGLTARQYWLRVWTGGPGLRNDGNRAEIVWWADNRATHTQRSRVGWMWWHQIHSVRPAFIRACCSWENSMRCGMQPRQCSHCSPVEPQDAEKRPSVCLKLNPGRSPLLQLPRQVVIELGKMLHLKTFSSRESEHGGVTTQKSCQHRGPCQEDFGQIKKFMKKKVFLQLEQPGERQKRQCLFTASFDKYSVPEGRRIRLWPLFIVACGAVYASFWIQHLAWSKWVEREERRERHQSLTCHEKGHP